MENVRHTDLANVIELVSYVSFKMSYMLLHTCTLAWTLVNAVNLRLLVCEWVKKCQLPACLSEWWCIHQRLQGWMWRYVQLG